MTTPARCQRAAMLGGPCFAAGKLSARFPTMQERAELVMGLQVEIEDIARVLVDLARAEDQLDSDLLAAAELIVGAAKAGRGGEAATGEAM